MLVNTVRAASHVGEFDRRVSFPVYQETAEEPVWNLLTGNKDDVFIYDRCGRLAYFVPYPLSVMSPETHSIVEQSLEATYNRSPCGDLCFDNSEAPSRPSDEVDDIVQEYIRVVRPPSQNQESGSATPNGNAILPASTATTPSEGFGWRVIHMVFGRGGTHSNHTSHNHPEGGSDNRSTHNHRSHLQLSPEECATIDKATCFDWPKERIRHVEGCCSRNHTSAFASRPWRRHLCHRLTRRRCKKLELLITCCKHRHEALDRQLEVEYDENGNNHHHAMNEPNNNNASHRETVHAGSSL